MRWGLVGSAATAHPAAPSRPLPLLACFLGSPPLAAAGVVCSALSSCCSCGGWTTWAGGGVSRLRWRRGGRTRTALPRMLCCCRLLAAWLLLLCALVTAAAGVRSKPIPARLQLGRQRRCAALPHQHVGDAWLGRVLSQGVEGRWRHAAGTSAELVA